MLIGFSDLEVIGDPERVCWWSDWVDPVRYELESQWGRAGWEGVKGSK